MGSLGTTKLGSRMGINTKLPLQPNEEHLLSKECHLDYPMLKLLSKELWIMLLGSL